MILTGAKKRLANFLEKAQQFLPEFESKLKELGASNTLGICLRFTADLLLMLSPLTGGSAICC